jgi:hypothetical protein
VDSSNDDCPGELPYLLTGSLGPQGGLLHVAGLLFQLLILIVSVILVHYLLTITVYYLSSLNYLSVAGFTFQYIGALLAN